MLEPAARELWGSKVKKGRQKHIGHPATASTLWSGRAWMIPSCGDRQAQPHEFSCPPVRQRDSQTVGDLHPIQLHTPREAWTPGRLLSCKRLARDGTGARYTPALTHSLRLSVCA